MASGEFGTSLNWATSDASFTGQNADTATSLYDFTFREHSSSQGRWISPDPAGAAAVDPSNPQSWNRYTYVFNDPLALVDPLGLEALECPEKWVCSEITVSAAPDDVTLESLNFDPGNVVGPPMGFGGAGGGGGAGAGAPSKGQEPPPACQGKILNATNNQFGTNYTNSNVTNTFNFSTGAGPSQGTLNLNISGSTAGVSTGYYPVHWWTYGGWPIFASLRKRLPHP